MIRESGHSRRSRPAQPTWISWNWHQRTASIVDELHIEWVVLETSRRGLTRYIELLIRTLALLWRLRRTTVFVQSPSVALAAMTVTLAPILGLRVVVDAHNESIRPFTYDTALMRGLLSMIMSRAHFMIVTNDELADFVRKRRGHPVVLADAIPKLPGDVPRRTPSALPVVLIVCTYAADEPLALFIETARRLAGLAEVRLTGRPTTQALDMLSDAPANLRVLGYLESGDYWAELIDAHCVVDLTLKPNCLVCGAYEAIAAGQSPILSDDSSSRRLFGEVADFVENTPESLTHAVRMRLTSPRRPTATILAFADRYMTDWRNQLQLLRSTVSW